MFTVPQFVAFVQTGAYAKGSKFKADCYDDVCLTCANTSMYVLVHTGRKMEFPEGGKLQDPEFMSTSSASQLICTYVLSACTAC